MKIAFAAIILIILALWSWRKPRQASAIVWALVATLFVCAATLKILPGSFADNAIWYGVSLPIIWASVQVWIYWDASKWRVLSTLIGAIVLSSAIIMFAPSPV